MISALHTDRYELTMLEALLASGRAENAAVFEVFARSLPEGRRYGVVAGTGRLVEAVADFSFGRDDLEFLTRSNVISERTANWLEGWRFGGSMEGYAEGEVYVPGSPVLTVTGGLGECIVLETVVLSMLNFDSGVATSAARTVRAAAGRELVEMGSRRTHEEAAVAAARAAYVAGFGATSNLLAGRRYGIPTAGTSAHSFTLAYPDEASAFEAQVRALGTSTTLLVDTFDPETAIARAVEVAGAGLGAVRIDSGDLGEQATRARRQLDDLGAHKTRIVLSGDLDPERIAALVCGGIPVDAFGVGTYLVRGLPPGFVYKLVEVADFPDPDGAFSDMSGTRPTRGSTGGRMRGVAKRGGAKATVEGRKRAWRRYGPDGRASTELVLAGAAGEPGDRPLQVPLVSDGRPVVVTDGRPVAHDVLDLARARCRASLEELPDDAFGLEPGEPCLVTSREPVARPRPVR